ncbi:MAG: hypothetical protein J1G02_04225 [Clostridiales bacterium]|nr:hypothetical protein [Clostridiales bacterium]
MKRKISVVASLAVLLLVASFLFSACWMYFLTYETDDGRYTYQYSLIRNDAFCENIWVRDDDLNYVIPDEIKGVPVTGLGRDIDTDVKVEAFNVITSTSSDRPSGTQYGWWTEDTYPKTDDYTTVIDDECQTLVINLHLGANISKIFPVDYWYRGYYIREGHLKYTYVILVKIEFHCTVSEKNTTFYAENGKLYYKDSGDLFDGFLYEQI